MKNFPRGNLLWSEGWWCIIPSSHNWRAAWLQLLFPEQIHIGTAFTPAQGEDYTHKMWSFRGFHHRILSGKGFHCFNIKRREHSHNLLQVILGIFVDQKTAGAFMPVWRSCHNNRSCFLLVPCLEKSFSVFLILSLCFDEYPRKGYS